MKYYYMYFSLLLFTSLMVILSSCLPEGTDTTAPVITITGASDGETLTTTVGTSITIPTATVNDNVDEDISVTTTITVEESTVTSVDFDTIGDYVITFSATDTAGNTVTATVTISVIAEGTDTTAPVITITGASDGETLTTTVGTSITIPIATATDDVDGNVDLLTTIEVGGSTVTSVDFNNVGDYVITFSATDTAGNTATAMVTISVIAEGTDTTAPVITITGASDGETLTTTVGTSITTPTATATDDVDEDISVTTTIEVGGATVDSVDFNNVGDYVITFSATDTAGNTATAMVTISVIAEGTDTTAPVITITGASDGETLTTTVGTSITIPTATVNDNVDEDISVTTTIEVGGATVDSVDFNNVGDYVITFSATDTAGNTATATVTISVEADTTAPVITITGASDGETLTTTVGTSITIPTATVNDNVDEDISVTTTIEVGGATVDSVDFNNVGDYVITFSATDTAGNTATATVTISVEADTTAPVITITGASDGETLTTTVGTSITTPTATVNDNVDEDISVTTTIEVGGATIDSVDFNNVGDYVITFSATDTAGNTATATVTISVEADTTAPVITITGASDGETLTTTVGTSITTPTATVNDNVDEDISVTTTIEVGGATVDSVDFNNVGDYVITFSATDTAGNTATATVTISVEADTTAPVITITGASDGETLTTTVGTSITTPTATVNDNVDGDISVTITIEVGGATVDSVDFNNVGDYVITFSATDTAGNTATAMVTISVLNTLLKDKMASKSYDYTGHQTFTDSIDDQIMASASIANATSKNVIVAGRFNVSSVSGNQIIFEAGGGAKGLVIAIEDDNFVVFVGLVDMDNTAEFDIDANLTANTDYAFVIAIDLDNDKVTVWLEQVADPNKIAINVAAKMEITFTEDSWAGNDAVGIGIKGNDVQGGYTDSDTLQNTLTTPVNDMIVIYANQQVNTP